MPKMEGTRSARSQLDGVVGLGELDEAALVFARSAPGELVAEVIESMISEVVDGGSRPIRHPVSGGATTRGAVAYTGCGRRRALRPRGFRPKPRKLIAACGTVGFRYQ